MKQFNRIIEMLGSLVKPGGGSGTRVRVLASTTIDDGTQNRYALLATGNTVPADGEAGFAKGCKFIDLDAAAGAIEYINEGTQTSCDFNLVRTPSGTGAVQYAEVTVTAAQMKALNATPITLVAAPGSGKLLEFISAVAILDYNSAAYAGIAANEDMVVRYTDGSGAIASTTLETTGFLDQTADQIRTHKAITTDLTPVANSPLVLHMLNGEITTGDSPVRYKVAYRIHNTGL